MASETPMTALPPSGNTDGVNAAHSSDDTSALTGSDVVIDDGDDGESPGTESGPSKLREEAGTCVTGWCNGDAQ